MEILAASCQFDPPITGYFSRLSGCEPTAADEAHVLPDYPTLKGEVLSRLQPHIQGAVASDPLLSDIPSYSLHEGRSVAFNDAGGEDRILELNTPLTATVALSEKELREGGSGAVARAIRELSDQFAAQLTTNLFSTISEGVERIGNVYDAKGQPLDAVGLAKVLDMMDLSFDADGSWRPPTIVMSPDQLERHGASLEAMGSDPAAQALIDEVVARKREVWRVREASRTLVD